MKENFEVNLDNLTQKEKESFLKLIKKSETILEPTEKHWKGKQGDVYYAITSEGRIVEHIEAESVYDKQCYQFGNYFQTKEEADFTKKRQLIYQQLKDYAVKHNEEKINWENLNQEKAYIRFNAYIWDVEAGFTYEKKDIGQIYFTPRVIAINAIKEIGKENIKHYLFGID